MDYMQASDAIRNLAKLFRHMEGAADALESIGTLDQAAAEKQAKIQALDIELTAVQMRVDGANEDARTMALQADSKLTSARNRADAIIDEAQTNAAGIGSRAQADAARVALEAKQKADAIIADVEKVANTAAETLKGRQHISDALAEEIVQKRAELATLQENINNARAKIAELLGK